MCGRYNLKGNPREIAVIFAVLRMPEFPQHWNIAPTQQVLTVRANGPSREAEFVRWGLVPFWSKDPKAGPPLINARSESVREKPSFREAFKRCRCLIPATGFYEWKRDGKAKQPFNIGMADESPFAFAGLWETWTKGPEPVTSCCIVTTDANELMATIHDRMPVIVDRDDYDTWLAGGSCT
jgi:putative SOS response-associated peptidase YedK